MPAGIFISYRRDDSRHAAGRLADDLSQAFGAERIFRDIEGIDLGVDFAKSLEKALAACSVMLVLIGPQWLGVQDNKRGGRRLDQADDWIRQEIVTALQRDVRVVPVLLEGAQLPDVAELPPDLQPLVRRQAMELSDVRWRGDLRRLIDALAKIPGFEPKRLDDDRPPARPNRKWMWIGGAVVVLALGALSSLLENQPGPAPVQPPAALQQLLPSGYGMKVCGCWGPNPAPLAPEPRCASGQVQIGACPGTCGPGYVPYGYRCL